MNFLSLLSMICIKWVKYGLLFRKKENVHPNNHLFKENNICAHKGCLRFGENSLRAVLEAFNNGYKVCEVDIASSADGILFLQHDPTIFNGDTASVVKNTCFKEICMFESKTQLSDLLENIRDKDVILNLDCNEQKRLHKTSLKDVFSLIRKYRVCDKVYVEVPVSKIFEVCCRNNGDINVEFPLGGKYLFLKKMLLQLFTFSSSEIIILNREKKRLIKDWALKRGYKVSYWTANSADEAYSLISSGYNFVGINC